MENEVKEVLEFTTAFLITIVVYGVSFGILIGVVKTTLKGLKTDIGVLNKKVNDDIKGLETNLNEKIKGLETGGKEDMERLEKKQDKHNEFIQRFTKVEVEHNIMYKDFEKEEK